jgi:hypothetical protein
MIDNAQDSAGLDRDTERAADRIARALMGEDPVAAVEARKAKEEARKAGMIARDREDAERETARQAAMIQVADGLTVNIGNTVVEPTPEWLAKGESRVVAVGGERWTDVPMSTRRRVVTSHFERAYNAGRITARQSKACAWYCEQHERSGLSGNVKSTNFEPRIAGTATVGLPFTPSQLDAQDELRNARLMIPSRLRIFFDKVVLDDIAITRASKLVHAGRHPIDSLRCCADRVADYVEFSTGKSM